MRIKRDLGLDGKTFAENENYWYYVAEDGYISKTDKKTLVEKKVEPRMIRGKLFVTIKGRAIRLARIVAEAFIPEYVLGNVIVCINGNERDCRKENLLVLTRQFAGRLHGVSANAIPIAVIYPDGRQETFRSIMQASKKIYCDRRTIANFMHRKYKKSYLDGYVIAPLLSVNYYDE